jgi:hypothetical protein
MNTGEAKTPEEAAAKAGKMILDVERLNIKAKEISATPLTKAETDALAQGFVYGLPVPLGMARGGDRTTFLRSLAQELQTRGVPNLMESRVEFKAGSLSIDQLVKMRDAVNSFEATAQKNLDLFLQQATRVIDSGAPWINTPLREVNMGTGDPDYPAYQAARQVAVNEIAKVTSSPNLIGVLSDQARKEVKSFIPANATLNQVYRVTGVLKQDMANRLSSMEDAIKERGEKLKDATHALPAPSSAPTVQHSKSTGRYRYSTDGGKTWQPGQPPQ